MNFKSNKRNKHQENFTIFQFLKTKLSYLNNNKKVEFKKKFNFHFLTVS